MIKKLSSLLYRVPLLRKILPWLHKHRKSIIAFSITFAHILGALTSVKAIMETRTSQGAVAWAISLNTAPFIALPAYWVFGSKNFKGYVDARRTEIAEVDPISLKTKQDLIDGDFLVNPDLEQRSAIEKIARLPMVRYNGAQLLIDGEATFNAIFESIKTAEDYILIQFFIIKDDKLGTRLKEALLEKAQQGVRVYVVYDEIGSLKLPASYIRELVDAGAEVKPFNTRRGQGNRFQLNFRNHRKIVIVDGKTAFIGGHNVGDEYLGLSEKFGHWRDTHVKVEGPVVLGAQVSFVEDWHWASDEIPSLNWTPARAPEGRNIKALCLPTGPADAFESCALFFLHSLNSAKSRIWIASPYFIPDEQIMSALKLAALRGVDVRILLPNDPDHLAVYLSSFSFLSETEKAGIKVLRYTDGFLHEKVMLIDDRISTIGTANFDNRSFRLNFEVTLLFDDVDFATEVEAMFERDFARSRQVSASEYTDRSFGFKFMVNAARLFDPIQ